MGQSRRWVQALEGGNWQTDPRISVLERAAGVLGVTLEQLLSDAPDRHCIDATELAAIRTALQRYDVITGVVDSDGAEPLPVAELRKRLVHARMTFQAGQFATLGRLVPDLLIDTNRAAACLEGDDQLEAFKLLSLSLELTEAGAIKFGDADLALVSGHRAVAAAERCQDPVIMASSARHLADAMTAHGEPAAGVAFALAAVARLEPDLSQRGALGLSVLGMLYLKAAMAQAVVAAETAPDLMPARAVPDYLDQAQLHAAELGRDDNQLWTSFGPTNVQLYRVAAHVQLSEGADAVAVAFGIPEADCSALPRERRAHLLADLARGLTQVGRREEAVDALLEAERDAADEVRCRPRSRQLVEDLRLLGAGAADGRLRSLAERCGLRG